MFDDLDLPSQGRFHPLAEATFLVSAISPDEFEPREAALKRSEQIFPSVLILKTGLMSTLMQDQTVRISEDIALAAFGIDPGKWISRIFRAPSGSLQKIADVTT